jgi:hypothetical protein
MRRSLPAAMLLIAMTITPSVAQAGCTLFQHRDYGGSSYYLQDHDDMKMVDGESTGCQPSPCWSILFEPSWNDQVSSFQVDPGCTITLWQHVNQLGAYFRTWRSYLYVGDDWNDEASEATCTCP